MKQEHFRLSQRYVTVLRQHLKGRRPAAVRSALRLGREAVALGLGALELARIHDAAVNSLELAKGRGGLVKRAESLFAEALIPIMETHRAAQQGKVELDRFHFRLVRRAAELAATNRQLKCGIVRRKHAEAALKTSCKQYAKLLKDSLQLQKDLRQMTHEVLRAQEDERKEISDEMQNGIAQTLLGINVRLLTVKREAEDNTKGLKNEIASTRRLVLNSAQSVRRVAREFGNA